MRISGKNSGYVSHLSGTKHIVEWLGTGGWWCPMAQFADKPDVTNLSEDRLVLSPDPLPPYELDPAFDNPVVRKRIGEVIAKAVGQRISKR